MNWDRFEDDVCGFLRDELRVDEPLDDDTSLYRSGLLDSASLVQLASFLETWAGISIPDREVKSENFDSLRAMREYLRARVQSG